MLERTDAKYTDVLFLPFLYGSNVNLGAEGAFIGLRSSSERDQLLRAVYEGVVFAHRHHVEQLLRVLGHKPKAIRISGGVCNSDPWVQMFADVLNLPVETVAVTELGGLGGAMCAAVGSGLYGSFQERSATCRSSPSGSSRTRTRPRCTTASSRRMRRC